MSLLFNMLSSFFCHSFSSKEQVSLNFMAAVTICSDFGVQENKVCDCFHCFLIYFPWSDGTRCHDLRFLYSSSVYSCHLFLISSASVRYMPFLSFIKPVFAWNVPLVSLIFLKRSLVFPILLFSSLSLHWSLRKVFLSLLAILWNSAFRCLYLSFSPLLLHFPSFHSYM